MNGGDFHRGAVGLDAASRSVLNSSDMRKLLIVAAVLVGLALGLYFLSRPVVPGASPGARSAPAERTGRVARGESPEDLGVRGNADAGSTPTLAQLPSEAEGVLEVEVLAGERPVPGASARLYWRGARDPNLGEVSWRLASTGTTDAQGRTRLASRPGSYLVAVRAQGLAPLLREVVRPHGEAHTLLRLRLEPGQSLTGRTVEKGSQEPLPLVEISLTAHGRKLDPWQDAEAPAEERVYATSDARGAFRVEGLAPGAYLLEARTPGHARAVLRDVKVPAKGPLTVALLPTGVIEGFVVDEQGQPAAGAEVLFGGFVPQETTTGEGGGFSVEVEPGGYLVSARRGGEAGSLDKPVSVSAGQTVRDIRVRLGRGAAVEGLVVARATGAPVEGARVDVSPYGRSGDSGRAVTDETGHFSVGALAPGSYDVVVSAPGFATLSRRGLTVASGERFPLELVLTGTGAVEGQVRDGTGQPVVGAQVLGGSRWSHMLGDAVHQSRTDAEGHYRLEGLDVGRLYLTAQREGSALGVSLPVEVTEGTTARVDFTLEETGTVEGRVRASRGELPAEKLAVTAFAQKSAGLGSPGIGQVEVEPTGTFRMVLPPGTYELYVASTEHQGAGLRRSKQVRVVEGETVQVELVWRNEDSVKEELLQGIVLEPDGTPSPEAFVTVTTGNGYSYRGGLIATDDLGRFSLPLPPGREASSDEPLRVSARNGGRLGEVTGVKPGTREVTVRLRPGASIQGRVVRAGGDSPVRGFTLSLQARGEGLFPQEESTWEFPGEHFELRDVPAEPGVLVAHTKDGAQGEAQIKPESGTTARVEISLEASAGVSGRVLDATTRTPVAEAFVFLESTRPLSLNQTTASDGRFTLEAAPPGEHTLIIVAGASRETERRPVTLVEGQVLDVGDILLRPPRVPPGSIGVSLQEEGTQLLLDDVTPHGPAAQAGLREGDLLLAVDGTPVASIEEAFTRMMGAPGSAVVLTVKRKGAEQSVSVLRAPGELQ